MKTKYINIPKDQRRAMRTRARDSLLHWKAMHIIDDGKYTPLKDGGMYKFGDDYLLLKVYVHTQRIYFHHLDEDGQVILDVTKEQWTRDLFNQLYNGKAKAN